MLHFEGMHARNVSAALSIDLQQRNVLEMLKKHTGTFVSAT